MKGKNMNAKKIALPFIIAGAIALTGCRSDLTDFKPVQTLSPDEQSAPEQSIGFDITSSDNNSDTESSSESSTATTTTDTSESSPVIVPSITESDAEAIVKKLTGDIEKAVKSGDKATFRTYFTNAIPSENVEGYWNYLIDYYDNGTRDYKTDTAAFAFTDNEILFDMMLYWNYVNPENIYENQSSQSTSNNLYIIKENNNWRMHYGKGSNEIQKKYRDRCESLYGKKTYENGFCTGGYQLKNNRSLLAGINIDVFTATLNDDGSVNLVLGIQNGYSFDRYLDLYDGKISFGKSSDASSEYIDLSKKYICNDNLANLKLNANSVTYTELTIPKSSLLLEIKDANILKNYCKSSINFRSQNLPY